jgi:hypothetical protein
MPSLAEFQRDFAAALLAPATSARDDLPPGLRVHRNTVIKALVDAVQANYPTIAVLMGQQWLSDVAREYAWRHPPRHAVLADYGADFPAFLRELAMAGDWPWLCGVAELDRAWTEALHAPHAPALTPDALRGIKPSGLSQLRLRLLPATRYGVYAGSAVTVWRANRPPAIAPAELAIDGSEEAALITRGDAGVALLPLDAGGRAFVEAIIAGCTMGEAAAAALELATAADVAANWATLLASGALAKLHDQGD